MNRLTHKRTSNEHRKRRIRDRVKGTADRPRLSVKISNTAVAAQIINDESGATLVAAQDSRGANQTEKAQNVGAAIAKAAKEKKIKRVVFDKNGRQYQQRLNALAEAARKEGLEF